MIVRKLNSGDARGLICEVETFIISRWDLKCVFTLSLRVKNQNTNDIANVFEIMPLDTPLTRWEDQEYIDWIIIHDKHIWDGIHKTNYCPECGSIGSIIRNKDGKIAKFNDGRL